MDKFYKILRIIFMIFIIFSIVSRVFAVDTYTTVTCYGNDYNAKINYFISPYRYYYVCNYKTASNIVCFDVLFSDAEFYFYQANSGNITTVSNNTNYDNISIRNGSSVLPLYHLHCQWRNTVPATAFTNLFNKLNSLTIDPSSNVVYYYQDNITGNNIKLSTISNGYTNLNGSSSTQINIGNNTNISNFDIKNAQGTTMFNNNAFINPYFENSSFISDWDFDNLFLNYGSLTYSEYDQLIITLNGSTNSIHIPIKDFITTTGAGSVVNPVLIPQTELNKYIYFSESFGLNFKLFHYETPSTYASYDLGLYNITLTSDQVDYINNSTERDIQNDILQTNQQINDSVNNLNDTINNPTVDMEGNNLPSINIDDPTQNGINNIFTNIYNAFCTGQPRDIVLPIPNTRKGNHYSTNYVE